MITVLSLSDDIPRHFFWKIKALFKPCTISATLTSDKKISVLHIRYLRHRGSIKFKKIYSFALGSPKEILCRSDIDLSNTPFVRFESNELSLRLFYNSVRSILKTASLAPEHTQLTLYDEKGEYSYFAELLLQYASQVRVITDAREYYEKEAQRYMDTFGASLIIQRTLQNRAGILISPSRLHSLIPLEYDDIVFTPEPPAVGLRGIVFERMMLCPPPSLLRLKPDEIDDITFLSALYTLEYHHEIAKIPIRGFETCGKTKTLAQCSDICRRRFETQASS